MTTLIQETLKKIAKRNMEITEVALDIYIEISETRQIPKQQLVELKAYIDDLAKLKEELP